MNLPDAAKNLQEQVDAHDANDGGSMIEVDLYNLESLLEWAVLKADKAETFKVGETVEVIADGDPTFGQTGKVSGVADTGHYFYPILVDFPFNYTRGYATTELRKVEG